MQSLRPLWITAAQSLHRGEAGIPSLPVTGDPCPVRSFGRGTAACSQQVVRPTGGNGGNGANSGLIIGGGGNGGNAGLGATLGTPGTGGAGSLLLLGAPGNNG